MTTEQYSIGYEAGYQDGFDAALAEPVKQEPVAWMFCLDGCNQVVLDEDSDSVIRHNGTPLVPAPVQPVKQEPVVYYAYATIKEYEELAGFSVSEAFRMGWNIARTTNSMLGINAAPVSAKRERVDLTDEELEALHDRHAGSWRVLFNAVVAAHKEKNCA